MFLYCVGYIIHTAALGRPLVEVEVHRINSALLQKNTSSCFVYTKQVNLKDLQHHSTSDSIQLVSRVVRSGLVITEHF